MGTVTGTGVWTTRGFEAFRRGVFGNAGQNLYVSRGGILQRIHQYDLDRDGTFDIIFCNSQAHSERAPAYVIRDSLGYREQRELIAEGAVAGAVADLNGDGYDDLVLGCLHNGVTTAGQNALVYYGSPEGWSERRHIQLPAPECTGVAAGRFDGGKHAIAFLLPGVVRLFYQTDLGFEMKRFIDLPIDGESIAASDLDDDGCTDLLVRGADGNVRVYWGSPKGIDAADYCEAAEAAAEGSGARAEDGVSEVEYVADAPPLVGVVRMGSLCIFAPTPNSARLIPVGTRRTFGRPVLLPCRHPMAAAVGDINGDGYPDLVVACRDRVAGGRPSADAGHGGSFGEDAAECSWVFRGSSRGIAELGDTEPTAVPTSRACDVVVGDLDGDGFDDVVFCQNRSRTTYSTESLIYRGSPDGLAADPVRVPSHDARRAFIVRSSDDDLPQVAVVNHFAGTASDTVKASIYYGGADGYSPERREDIVASGSVEVVCSDLDDDGLVDLVLVNASEYSKADEDVGSFVLYNRGIARESGPVPGETSGAGGDRPLPLTPPLYPSRPDIVLPTVHAHGGVCADLNRDGYLDLVFGGFGNPELLVFYGTPEGFDPANPVRIRMEHDGVLYNEPRWLYLADLDNDGWLDLVVPQIAFDRSFILWGGPEGFSMERIQLLSVYHACCARAADLTGNGYLDLIVGGHRQSLTGPADSFVSVYWNGPEGLSEERKMLLPAEAVNSMAVGDFNNDGFLDLFVASYASPRERDVPSFFYWNREGRGFSPDDRTRLFTHSASGCIACDLDEDGRVDLVVANHKVEGDHLGCSTVWWNGPEGFDEKNTVHLPTAGPHGMTCIGPGNVADRGPEEYYVSEAHKLPETARVTGISWEAEVPAKTWVKAQMRFAATREELADAPWTGPDGPRTWFDGTEDMSPREQEGPWTQYRLALGAVNSLNTPRVRTIMVRHR